MVDFAIVNEGYCRDRRFCGTDPIFPTQRIPRGRDPILSTQRICQINDVVKNLMGAMHQKIAIFKEENSVCSSTKFSKITKWRYFLDGHKMALTTKNLKLKNKTCQEISKITKWHYYLDGHKMALLFR